MKSDRDNPNVMSPFNMEASLQERLKQRNHTYLEEELVRESRQASLSNPAPQECIPACYMGCLECCGNQMSWMRCLCPCLCLCVKSPFFAQSNASFGLVENFGRYKETLTPGYHFVNPFTEKVVEVSRQTQIIECQQPVFTKDNIACVVTSTTYFRVVDPTAMLYKLGLQGLKEAVKEMSLAAIRTISSESLFQDLIEKRKKFEAPLLEFVNDQLTTWGVFVENIFVKDILLDQELQAAMSLVAQTKRKAEATLIGSRAQVESAKFFAKAAEELDNKAAQQIRYLETINEISQMSNPKIIMIRLRHPH